MVRDMSRIGGVCLLLGLFIAAVLSQTRNYSSFPCPSNCICFRKTVRCMKLGIKSIPNVSPLTILLDLRFNNIEEIIPGALKDHEYLRSLLLNNNKIAELKNGAFNGLLQLRHLYIYNNKLKYIDAHVFQGLHKLEHLYLHGNELKTFSDGTFSNLPSLDRLFLYKNQIERISPGLFKNLPRLTRLRLDQNALICDCNIAWFPKMMNENSLDISANCKYPREMYGKLLKEMTPEDFHCKFPIITEDPNDVEISLGGTAIFTCKVLADSNTSIIWMKNDEPIDYTYNKFDVLQNGSLVVKNSDINDQGHYECMVKNNDGEVKSRSARMIVRSDQIHRNQMEGAPTFTATPISISTTQGTPRVQFFCRATGNPPPRYIWSFNGIKLLSSEKHEIHQDGTLIVHFIVPRDHGTYLCEAYNHLGKVRAEANIIINSAPVFTVYPETTDITAGKTLSLSCAAVGSPKPQLLWYKNEILLQPNDRIAISGDGNFLEIREVNEHDEDTYTCRATNEMGTKEASATVKVGLSKFKPPKLVYKPYNIEAIIGTTIEMPCKAEGTPAPGIQWQKDGSRMLVTGRFKVSFTGNLYIFNVAPEDQGKYECTAINDYGRDTAYGYISVKEDDNRFSISSPGISDKFVKIAFAQASKEVDNAINNTVDNLFHSKKKHNPGELFRLFRYPDAPTRELAKAAEIYERTLVNIRNNIEKGMTVNTTMKDYSFKDVLSKEHLQLIASLSGCTSPRLVRNCSDMCFHSRYRTIDGSCNNLQNPTWGASLTAFRRLLKPIYEDGFSKPIGWDKNKKYNGFKKPLSRLVSTTLIATNSITQDEEITHMTMQWGQFLDHDLDHALPSVTSESWDGVDCKKTCDYAAPCYPMDMPPNDPRGNKRRCIDFIRTSAICGSGMTSVFYDDIQPREQINQLTSYIDASQVYGFSEELGRELRDLNSNLGRLKEGPEFPGRKPLLPYATNQGMDCRRNLSESDVSCFLAGDIRVNEQVGLIAMHTIWMREHNRLTKELKALNPHWESDMLYQEARKIVGSAMQHITFKHWLPLIIGESGMQMLGKYKGYNPDINPSISNVFATAALRFGHTLINPILHRLDANFSTIREGHLPLRHAFFSPWRIVDEGGIDPLLRGMITVPAKVKTPTENLNQELTEHLFETAHALALDLASMNIHRSRDHGIPGYSAFRKVCNLSVAQTFDDLKHDISNDWVRQKLQELYGHPDNIDVFVGGILEDQVEDARVGPLFQCLLTEQFRRLRDGDRFYYENPSVFKPEQLVYIKQYTLSQVLCNNGDNITNVPLNSFIQADLQNGFVECATLPKVSLKLWSEFCSDCRFSGQPDTCSLSARRSKRDITLDDGAELQLLNNDKNTTIGNLTTYLDDKKQIDTKITALETHIRDLRETMEYMKTIIKEMQKKN